MRVDQLLEWSAERCPEKTAVVFGGKRYTYSQIEERANRIAHGLIGADLQLGDRVAIRLDNSIEAVVAMFAVLKAGGVFVIVNPRVRPEWLSCLLADSGATMQITFESLGALEAQGGQLTPPPKRHVEANLAALIYTSGSTGEPKGVMLTHRNLTAAAESICTYLEIAGNDVILNVLPLAFTYGLGQLTSAFHRGATLVLERSFAYPAAVVDTLTREQVTGFPLVPTMATVLLQQDLKRRRFPHLRYITNAAAALPAAKIDRLRAAFPETKIYSMYGLTECQRASYLPPDQLNARPTSVGIAIPGTDALVVDEGGHRVTPGTVGELVVRGPHVMAGYWHQPEATAKALRPDPVSGDTMLYTGDLFWMDRDGFLYFVDRKDDIIKTRGEKVAPRQIEEVIAQLPGIAEVAVYGVPDDLLGQAIAAVIMPIPGVELTSAQVRRHCLHHLEPFMVPTVVDIRGALPTTMTGKVNRRALRAMAMASEATSA